MSPATAFLANFLMVVCALTILSLIKTWLWPEEKWDTPTAEAGSVFLAIWGGICALAWGLGTPVKPEVWALPALMSAASLADVIRIRRLRKRARKP